MFALKWRVFITLQNIWIIKTNNSVYLGCSISSNFPSGNNEVHILVLYLNSMAVCHKSTTMLQPRPPWRACSGACEQAAIFVHLTRLFLQAPDGRVQQMLFHLHSIPGVQEQKEVMAPFKRTPIQTWFISGYTLWLVFIWVNMLVFFLPSTRNYTVPDPPGLFDGHVWPMYLKHRAEMEESPLTIGE